MGSPLGPVLAGIFMVHLERTLLQKIEKSMNPWKRHADDTITYIKPDFITDVINILNKFHENIKFTYKVGHNGCNWTRTQNNLVRKRTLNHLIECSFVYELIGFGFKSSCSHLNFRFCACFEQGVP